MRLEERVALSFRGVTFPRQLRAIAEALDFLRSPSFSVSRLDLLKQRFAPTIELVEHVPVFGFVDAIVTGIHFAQRTICREHVA